MLNGNTHTQTNIVAHFAEDITNIDEQSRFPGKNLSDTNTLRQA